MYPYTACMHTLPDTIKVTVCCYRLQMLFLAGNNLNSFVMKLFKTGSNFYSLVHVGNEFYYNAHLVVLYEACSMLYQACSRRARFLS